MELKALLVLRQVSGNTRGLCYGEAVLWRAHTPWRLHSLQCWEQVTELLRCFCDCRLTLEQGTLDPLLLFQGVVASPIFPSL